MFLLQSSYLHSYYDPKNQSNRKHPIVGHEVLDLKIKNKRVPFMGVTDHNLSMGDIVKRVRSFGIALFTYFVID